MKTISKLLSIFLAVMLVFSSFAMAFADETDAVLLDAEQGEDEYEYEEPPVLGEWKTGATSSDDITATWTEGTLWFSGTGRMKDYEKLSDRPWNDCIGSISYIMFDDGIENIGKNAFAGLGKDLTGEWDTADCYYPESMTEIGEGAFADAKLYFMIEFRNSVKIGSKAYAYTGRDLEFRFDGEVCEIADDAFAGCSGKIFTVEGYDWDKTKQYGGSFEYITQYEFNVVSYYDDEENGSMTMLIPEGEEVDYFADCWMDGYGFDYFELVSGSFPIDDPANPQLNGTITDNVLIKEYFKAGNENQDRPEPETMPCPFVVTTADGQPALDDIEGDYYWSEFSNAIILYKSGLTVSLPNGVKSTSAYITSSFSEEAELTLKNVVIEGPEVYFGLMSNFPLKVNLVGENKVISTEGSFGYIMVATENVSFAGKGSLYITGNADNAAMCAGELSFEDKLKITGSAEENAVSGLTELEYVGEKDGTQLYTYFVKGTENACKTLLIKGESFLQSPVLPLAIIVVLIAVVLIARRKKK